MQKPAGVILSMARFRIWRPKEIFFNIALFLWQLGFLIWTYVFDTTRRIFVGIITVEIIFLTIFYGWHWFWLFLWLAAWIIYALIPGRVPLWLIILAALVMHVRLCLERIEGTNRWRYISQSAPDARIDEWSEDQLLGRHFIYMRPMFRITDAEIQDLIRAADSMVAPKARKIYDYLQLLSFIINSLIFWWMPVLHGKQIIKLFNYPGGREVCSTAIASLLRNNISDFRGFQGYDTAMVFPALYYISELWSKP